MISNDEARNRDKLQNFKKSPSESKQKTTTRTYLDQAWEIEPYPIILLLNILHKIQRFAHWKNSGNILIICQKCFVFLRASFLTLFHKKYDTVVICTFFVLSLGQLSSKKQVRGTFLCMLQISGEAMFHGNIDPSCLIWENNTYA